MTGYAQLPKLSWPLITFFCAIAIGCSSDNQPARSKIKAKPPTVKPNPCGSGLLLVEEKPTYQDEIQLFLKGNCLSCHNKKYEDQPGQGAFHTFELASTKATRIYERLDDMPPGSSTKQSDKKLFKAWLDAGAPENDQASRKTNPSTEKTPDGQPATSEIGVPLPVDDSDCLEPQIPPESPLIEDPNEEGPITDQPPIDPNQGPKLNAKLYQRLLESDDFTRCRAAGKAFVRPSSNKPKGVCTNLDLDDPANCTLSNLANDYGRSQVSGTPLNDLLATTYKDYVIDQCGLDGDNKRYYFMFCVYENDGPCNDPSQYRDSDANILGIRSVIIPSLEGS